MLRTSPWSALSGGYSATLKVLAVCLGVLWFGLSTAGQSEKVPDDRPHISSPSQSIAPSSSSPITADRRSADLASRLAAAPTEETADAVLASDPTAAGKGLGRALLAEIIRLRDINTQGDRLLTVAMRLVRYSKRPEMAAERGFAHRGLGLAYASLGKWYLAEKELQTAVGLFRRGGGSTHHEVLFTMRDLATLYYQRGDQPRALDQYEQLRAIASAIGDSESLAQASNALATVYLRRGDFEKANEHLEMSLTAAGGIKDQTLKMTTLAQLAAAFLSQGRIVKAVEAYDAAYRTAVESGSPTSVNYLFQSGLAHIKLGDHSSAYARFRTVQAESSASADRRLYISSLLNIAWIQKQHGQETSAAELYERIVALADNEISKGPENNRPVYISAKAEAFNRLAEIHSERGETQKAIELYTRNLKMLQTVAAVPASEPKMRPGVPDTNTVLEIGINRSLGELQSSLGNNAEASAHLATALALAEKTGYESGLIDTLLSMATHAARLGDPTKAFSYVSRVELMVRRNGRLDQSLKLRTITAGILRKLGRPASADLAYQDAVRISESLRTDVVMPDQRASYFSSLFAPFDEYIEFLMERHEKEPDAGFDGRAFNVSERRRARALLDSLKVARADIRQGVEPSLLEKENRIRNQLNSAAREQFSTIDLQSGPTVEVDLLKTPVVTPKADIAMLTAELSRVETAIRRQSPRYAELMQPRPLRWGAVQTLLDDKTVLFNYTLGAKRSFLWTITQDGVRSFILPPRSDIEALVKTVYNHISGSPDEHPQPEGFKQAADALSRILLEPAAATIGSKKIIIVADGALQYLPFSSLPDPRTRATTKEPILFFNEVQFAPSASVVAVLRQEAERRPAPPRSVAVFADPVFSTTDDRFEDIKAVGRPTETRAVESLVSRELFVSRFLSGSNATGKSEIPRLPFSRREADAIFSNAPAATSFKALDFEASREKVASIDLSKYGIVHFATHGILHSEHPELSGVVLSLFNESGEPVNGFLRLNEIYNMKLNADLVVLSACQTALGKEVRGEGLIGLTRGFMYAGSPRVVASLWKVDDVATAELMKIFYQRMLKENLRPASALRAAKLEMIRQKRWSSPYFWAAFELQGEWR